MATKFGYDKYGNPICIDTNTGEKTGEIVTMGNVLKKDEIPPEWEKLNAIKKEFEKKYQSTVK